MIALNIHLDFFRELYSITKFAQVSHNCSVVTKLCDELNLANPMNSAVHESALKQS